MNSAILASESLATALQSIVATACGMPLDGVDIGGGIHAPPEMTRTLYLDGIRKHPTASQWATAVVDGLEIDHEAATDLGLSGVDLDAIEAAVGSAAELGEDWNGGPC